jgi:hypothetical protein
MKMKEISLLKNKKAIFYLLVTTLFITVMIFIFVAYKEYTFTDKQKVVETRVRTINDFIRSIDSDSKRVIYISGFRSLIAIEDYVAKRGQYINNTAELFKVAFYNGTVNGTKVDVLVNSSYYDYLQKLKVIAGRLGINIDLNVTNVTLYHESPFSIAVIVTAYVNITDQKSVARWEFYKDYSTSVSLVSIRDPVYSVTTLGRVPNPIRINNITDFVDDSNNDTTNLQLLVNNSYYTANPLAPSFLMRLEGNFSNSTYGIESFVDVTELIAQVVNYNASRSIIDYVLFSNITGYNMAACNVQNMPAWFIIDLNHTNTYEVNKLNYTIC